MPIAGVSCAPPCSGVHARAPHGDMGSLVLSPYSLVGREWALSFSSPPSLNVVVIESPASLSDKLPVFPDSPSEFPDDHGNRGETCCLVCGIYVCGGCSHALSRLGPVHSIVALGMDICGSDNLETRVDFGSVDLRHVVVSSPPPI